MGSLFSALNEFECSETGPDDVTSGRGGRGSVNEPALSACLESDESSDSESQSSGLPSEEEQLDASLRGQAKHGVAGVSLNFRDDHGTVAAQPKKVRQVNR